mmetsp:Transcript_37119/g.80828  ORF Transcript_37119/g.80828 Transcript_37119/m.80828 type:complete len:108 (+) Transcript_37119:159-482(+)
MGETLVLKELDTWRSGRLWRLSMLDLRDWLAVDMDMESTVGEAVPLYMGWLINGSWSSAMAVEYVSLASVGGAGCVRAGFSGEATGEAREAVPLLTGVPPMFSASGE